MTVMDESRSINLIGKSQVLDGAPILYDVDATSIMYMIIVDIFVELIGAQHHSTLRDAFWTHGTPSQGVDAQRRERCRLGE